MTPQEINAAIAKAAGWRLSQINFAFRSWLNAYPPGTTPPLPAENEGVDESAYEVGWELLGVLPLVESFPDYHEDRSAICKLIKALPFERLDRLTNIACIEVKDPIDLITMDTSKLCEFYLRAIDQWRPE